GRSGAPAVSGEGRKMGRTNARTGKRRPQRRGRRKGGVLRGLLLACLLLGAAGALAAGGVVLWLTRDLPRFDAMLDYTPREATRVFAADGTLVATFHEERRTVVPPEEIPEVLKRAILAAEDASF